MSTNVDTLVEVLMPRGACMMFFGECADLMKDKVDGTLGCPGLVKLGLSLDMGRSLFQAPSL